ncbi:hypothetical protein [Acanthopleuribacter pedis]|uniref:Uncharacterized protein n=1 Tax=Acanthopleuribacter pedis TaxID=442870 RepID=A0A8J7U448_9BACT|nr:hypothetical protein [Acanthopleuribacter pedis]MBO1317946.1 hypothetical protein [Acanthopleuribacter pedis]
MWRHFFFWTTICLAAVSTLAGFQWLDAVALQTVRPCQAACPCDAPEPLVPLAVEPCQTACEEREAACDGAAEPAVAHIGDHLVPSMDTRPLLEPDQPTPPCPGDCPDCHCHAGVAIADLAETASPPMVSPLAAFIPEPHFGFSEGSVFELFRPPRLPNQPLI